MQIPIYRIQNSLKPLKPVKFRFFKILFFSTETCQILNHHLHSHAATQKERVPEEAELAVSRASFNFEQKTFFNRNM